MLVRIAADRAFNDDKPYDRFLREQIADYLAANRGLRCDPGAILVTNGTQQAVRLCASALLQAGDRLWMEDPGYPVARNTFVASGLVPVAVPVVVASDPAERGRLGVEPITRRDPALDSRWVLSQGGDANNLVKTPIHGANAPRSVGATVASVVTSPHPRSSASARRTIPR